MAKFGKNRTLLYMSYNGIKIISTILLVVFTTTSCTQNEIGIEADTKEIIQPIFAVSMSNSLTALIAQQRLSPLSASRVYGYMFAASLEAFHSAKAGDEVHDAVSAAVVVGNEIFLGQRIPIREIDTLVRRFSPDGITESGEKIGKIYVDISRKDGYFENAQESYSEVSDGLWEWEPTGLYKAPFSDPGHGDVLPLIPETRNCILEEPDKDIMAAEVAEIFANFNPEQTAEPGVLVFLSGISTPTPPGLMLQISALHASDAKLDNKSALNLLALVAISDLDAGIGIWREKRKHMIARPETVYRRMTGEVVRLARETPPHPSYPSGHSGFTGAATSVMEKFIGSDTPLRLLINEDLAAPSEEWVINNTAELREMVNWSRVRAAIHTQTDVDAGEKLGTCIGNHVYEHYKEKGWL